LGYTGTEVVFQNTSGLSCFMDGYLKVWFVDGTGGRLGTVSSDQSGKVSRVIIGPGQSASSTIWAGNPLTLEGNRPCQPEATSGLDVILPGQTVVTFVRVEQPGNLSVCTVSPVNRVWTSPITAGTQEALWGG
jgi:hypothetical protein